MSAFVSEARSRGADEIELIRLVRAEFSLSLIEAKALVQTGNVELSALSERQARLIPAIEQAIAEADSVSPSTKPATTAKYRQQSPGEASGN